jgi:hypothetical protein
MKANEMHYFSNLFEKYYILTTLAYAYRTSRTNTYCLYSVEILLMDSGHVRNMLSTLSNKLEK